MSEIINNKAVELSDDELDGVAGGRAVLMHDEPTYQLVVKCDYKKMKADDFKQNYTTRNTCDHYSSSNGSNVKNCNQCTHFTLYQCNRLGTPTDIGDTIGWDQGQF